MPENLTTTETEQLEEEVLVEFSTREDYISSCYNAISAVDGFDTGMMSKIDQGRVRKIQRRCLRILDACTKEMYDEFFDDDDE